MKSQSKLFDTIRIRPRREEKPAPIEHVCEWEGCDKAGEYKAPKGARGQGQYHQFCLEHVRHYNTSFNFFAGMEKEGRMRHMSGYSISLYAAHALCKRLIPLGH